MRALLIATLALASCSGSSSSSGTCSGAAPTATLVEGYCKNGETADRCYFDAAPMDGF